jgi:drug/metabolite transporter (DMT)-like permease
MGRRTAVLTAAAMVAFAANSLLCRGALGADRIDPVTFTTVRIVTGGIALAAIARARGAAATAGSWSSALALAGYAIMFSLAYTRIAAGTGALLLFAAVQATMVSYALLQGARLRHAEWIGLVMALAGLVVLTRPGFDSPDALGAALMVAAGVAWGIYTLRGRGERDALGVTAGNFARGVVPAAALSAAHGFVTPPSWSTEGLALATASGMLASGVGYVIWYSALPGLTPAGAAIVQLSAPVLAAIGGILLLGEALSWRLVIATPLVLGGIALALAARAAVGSPGAPTR